MISKGKGLLGLLVRFKIKEREKRKPGKARPNPENNFVIPPALLGHLKTVRSILCVLSGANTRD